MESTPKNPPVIFSKEIDQHLAIQKLQECSAHKSSSKAKWLLRESSVPGLLTATYYNTKGKTYIHTRIGYVDEAWCFAPANRQEAIVFASTAQAAFSDKLPDESAEQLFNLLAEYGLKSKFQVLPNPIEATRTEQYSRYVFFTLEDSGDSEHVEDSKHTVSSTSDRHGPFG